MLGRLRSARATVRSTPRRWVRALLVLGIALTSAWVSLTLTPPATVRLGVVSARISAAPGSGTVVSTTEGRPVTDATLNNGPLQVQVAVAVSHRDRVTEPQLLAAIKDARPRVIGAVAGYLARFVAGTLLVSFAGCLLVFGRGRRRLLVTGLTALGVVGTGVSVTAATSTRSAFDVASCAHGWSRYVLADLSDLSPPAPAVTPPDEATASANPGLLPVVLISDVHLNPEGLGFARSLQRTTGATAVLDAGDTTSYGVAGEACVVAPLIRSFRVPYIWVRGNHDSAAFASTMRTLPGVHVLDGTATTVSGLNIFGVADPSFTPRRHTPSERMDANAARVRASLPSVLSEGELTPDVVLVHECRMAASDEPGNRGLVGLVPLVACGHTHEYAESVTDGTTVLHTGTAGAGGLAASERPLTFDAQLLLFTADAPNRLVRYYDVSGSGGRPATFTRHDVPVEPDPLILDSGAPGRPRP